MSHFTVAVITKGGTEREVDALLAPFDENLTVGSYVSKQQIINKQKNEVEDYKNGLYQEYLNDPKKYLAECNNESHKKYISEGFPKKMEWTDEQLYQDGISWEEDDDIMSDGSVFSEYNPKSKWDWFVIGGRWKNSLELNDGSFVDTSKIKDVNYDKFSAFAMLTPEGDWLEKGKMGWWAISDATDESRNKFNVKSLAALEEYKDFYVTIVDCHI